MFSQSEYSVNEDAGAVQPVLVISNPASTNITVQVTRTDISDIGEYYSILINYWYCNGMTYNGTIMLWL